LQFAQDLMLSGFNNMMYVHRKQEKKIEKQTKQNKTKQNQRKKQ
jgi:hypothetical protein